MQSEGRQLCRPEPDRVGTSHMRCVHILAGMAISLVLTAAAADARTWQRSGSYTGRRGNTYTYNKTTTTSHGAATTMQGSYTGPERQHRAKHCHTHDRSQRRGRAADDHWIERQRLHQQLHQSQRSLAFVPGQGYGRPSVYGFAPARPLLPLACPDLSQTSVSIPRPSATASTTCSCGPRSIRSAPSTAAAS